MRDLQHFDEFVARGNLQVNLLQEPKNTYIFDEYDKKTLEDKLDKVNFFSDLELGINVDDFINREYDLGHFFVPIGTFDDSTAESQNKEFVSLIEGVEYPWFGTGFRLDKIQYSLEHSKRDLTDHSRDAIAMAQNIANLFVDEARLSGNEFQFVIKEVEAIAKI